MRDDLADVRMAEHVFAPHYAWPLMRKIAQETVLHADRDPESDGLATLSPGDAFEVLEFARGLAWGVAPVTGLVGYVRADALAIPT